MGTTSDRSDPRLSHAEGEFLWDGTDEKVGT